jgi:hypothetical protein
MNMTSPLRFTGANPPPSIWPRYPNWENAWDEEGVRGQDETTLRPAENQQTIDKKMTFTAGDAHLKDGRILPALLIMVSGEIGWANVYADAKRDLTWMLRFDDPSGRWVAMNDDWFVGGKSLRVPLDEPGVFPLRLKSRLPLESTGKAIDLVIKKPSRR